MKIIRHGKGTVGRVVKVGDPISFPTKAVVPVTGAAYSYINQPIPGAAVGTIYHNAPNLTLDISSLDKNGNNHFSFLESLPPGCTITIGTQSALMPVKPTYVAGGMWNLTLDAWPALPDGNYNVTIVRPVVAIIKGTLSKKKGKRK